MRERLGEEAAAELQHDVVEVSPARPLAISAAARPEVGLRHHLVVVDGGAGIEAERDRSAQTRSGSGRRVPVAEEVHVLGPHVRDDRVGHDDLALADDVEPRSRCSAGTAAGAGGRRRGGGVGQRGVAASARASAARGGGRRRVGAARGHGARARAATRTSADRRRAAGRVRGEEQGRRPSMLGDRPSRSACGAASQLVTVSAPPKQTRPRSRGSKARRWSLRWSRRRCPRRRRRWAHGARGREQ